MNSHNTPQRVTEGPDRNALAEAGRIVSPESFFSHGNVLTLTQSLGRVGIDVEGIDTN